MKTQHNTVPFGTSHIDLITLTNTQGASVTLSSLGAGIIELRVPDRNGDIENVALAYADPADFLGDGPCMGKTPGRYANRIAHGHFDLDGKSYQLNCNLPPHHLHGGADGFQNKLWQPEILSDGVRFTLHSPDGDECYPGNMTATVTYRWSDDNTLSITFEATTDAPTVINLTNHTYWNLDGADSGCALKQQLRMKASHWLPTDPTLIPDGTLAPVGGTPMDFLNFKAVGEDINADFPPLHYGKGYDNCWVFDNWAPGGMIEDAVELRSPLSGRHLHIDTDQPGTQVYSGNWLAGSPLNHSGRSYADYDGIAIEAQGLPDAPNHPNFPNQRLNPGDTYRRTIRYRFTAD